MSANPTLAQAVAITLRERETDDTGKTSGQWGAFIGIAKAWAGVGATPERQEVVWQSVLLGRAGCDEAVKEAMQRLQGRVKA